MDFTYDAYVGLINRLKEQNYKFTSYKNWKNEDRSVILRHDIDYDISKAIIMAQKEHSCGVSSTFFVLITSDFYNVFSATSREGLRKILDYGCEIGLHFDEKIYMGCNGDWNKIINRIKEEANLLGCALDINVDCVSMHRPSKGLLDANIKIPGMINSYNSVFFKEFKYLSDSHRNWREPIDEIVKVGSYDRLHILTHAFWYNEVELDLEASVKGYISAGNYSRYKMFHSNFSNLEEIMSIDEVNC